MLIDGKVAIVLGGAGGMGKACCKALLAKGAKVTCADITDGKGVADLITNKNFIYLKCDSTSEKEIKDLFEKTKIHFGKIPEIVLTTVATMDEFNWERCLELNVTASIRLVNTALATMGKDKGGNGGCVVLISSISGLQPEFWGPVYAATKHAVTGLCRSWAMDENYKRHGIRFNCICPATVDTPFIKQCSQVYFSEWKIKEMEEHPKIKPETIADGFIRINENDSLNGAAVLVRAKDPFAIHEFPHIEAF